MSLKGLKMKKPTRSYNTGSYAFTGISESGAIPDVVVPTIQLVNGQRVISVGGKINGFSPSTNEERTAPLFRTPVYKTDDNKSDKKEIQELSLAIREGEYDMTRCPYCGKEVGQHIIEEYDQKLYGEVVGFFHKCDDCKVFWLEMPEYKITAVQEKTEW